MAVVLPTAILRLVMRHAVDYNTPIDGALEPLLGDNDCYVVCPFILHTRYRTSSIRRHLFHRLNARGDYSRATTIELFLERARARASTCITCA